MKQNKHFKSGLLILIVLTALILGAIPIQATVIFSDGFESGNISAWTSSTGSPTVQSSIKYNGTYAMNGTVGAFGQSFVEKDLTITSGVTNVTGFFRITAMPNSNGEVILLIDIEDGTTWEAKVGIGNDAGTLKWLLSSQDGGSGNNVYSTSNPAINNWYKVNLLYEKNTTQGVKLYVNDTLACTMSSGTTPARDTTFINAGNWYSDDASTVYMDAVAVYDSVAVDNTPLNLNGVWTHVDQVNSTFISRLEAANCWNVYLWVGQWETDHTITYWSSDAILTYTIDSLHAANSNFRVYPFLYWGASPVDISTSGYRSAMYSQIVACVNKGFDGFQDDLEVYTGSTANYVTYINGMADAVHALGKTASAVTFASYAYDVETIYPQLTHVDFICPMFYSSVPYTQAEMAYTVPRCLTYAAVPVSCGISITGAYSIGTILTWLDGFDLGGYSTYKGVSVWVYDDTVASDWTTFGAWIALHTSSDTYFITSSCDTHSTITPLGATSVTFGGNQAFNFSANAGYQISSVVVDGVPQSVLTSPYSFTSISANHTIAVFSTVIVTPTPTPTVVALTIVTPANRTYITSDIPVEITSGTNITSITYNIYNSSSWLYVSNVSYTVPVVLANFTDGSYIFYAYGTDTYGNVTMASSYFTVDIKSASGLPQLSVDSLWFFLWEGDFLGFIQAQLIAAFGNFETAMVLIVMLFLVPIYLRTKSLLLLAILWLMLGGFFVFALPSAAGISVLFMALGVGGLLWRLFRGASY